jgi:hypothetical protein
MISAWKRTEGKVHRRIHGPTFRTVAEFDMQGDV